MRGALSSRGFRWLYAARCASSLGDQVFPVAVAVLVLDDGGSAGDLGLVLAARSAALLLLSVVGGVWADRLPRVRVLVSADLLRLAAVLGLALVAASERRVLVLAALVFLVGAGEAFFRPAAGALLPSVLPEEHLAGGNALTSSTAQLALVVGPGAAGLVVAGAGVRAGFLLAAAAFALSAVALLRVHEPPPAPAVRAPLWREAAEGLAAVRERPWLAAALAVFSLNMLLVLAPVHVLLPVVVRDSTGRTATYGLVLSVGAVGGIAGAVLATRLRTQARGQVALLATLLLVLEPLALLAQLPLAGLAACWVLSAAGLSLFIVVWESSLQVDVPRAVLARVVSLDWMATFALYPLGLALTGPAVEAAGRTPVLLVAVVVSLVPPLLLLRVPGAREFRTPAPAACSRISGSTTRA